AAARVLGAAVRRLHDAATAPRADDEPLRLVGERLRPLGAQARQLAGLGVVASQRPVLGEPGRPEEDDGVLHPLLAERVQGLQVLGEDPERPRLVALEEGSIEVRDPARHFFSGAVAGAGVVAGGAASVAGLSSVLVSAGA